MAQPDLADQAGQGPSPSPGSQNGLDANSANHHTRDVAHRSGSVMATLEHSSKIHTLYRMYHPVGPPYTCYLCSKNVQCQWDAKRRMYVGPTKWYVAIHHIDEDQANNDPKNLAIVHFDCHTAHHGTGRKQPQSAREAVAEANATRVVTAETRAKMSATRQRLAREGIVPPRSTPCKPNCTCGKHRK